MRWFTIVFTLFFILVAGNALADSCNYYKRISPNGEVEVHVWEWTSTDGTFDLNDATSNSDTIYGPIVGVRFYNSVGNAPDTDYTVYLYDEYANLDWLIGVGANIDGTSNTTEADALRSPMNEDAFLPYLHGVKLRPYVSGPGSGTRSGTIFLTVIRK